MDWITYTQNCYRNEDLDFSLDYSTMAVPANFFAAMQDRAVHAIHAMEALEKGAIANPDENRMVGHYWLRAPQMAPSPHLRHAIESCLEQILSLAAAIHRGDVQSPAGPYTDFLVIGIGGSALGPQFVAQALGREGEDRLRAHFLDNTDPDGIDAVLSHLRGRLDRTLAIVISKSGGTPETRNGMLETMQAFLSEGLDFARQAIAITGEGSQLDQKAIAENWLARFPMWDWVGGRTSELAAVGLLPAALQGFDIREMLDGAASMDALTRHPDPLQNPAALLALLWYHATNGKGSRDMVILPYKDRLMLLSKYLQQLIMESLGKEKDLDGNIVHQGIAVYGNKGSTDQHAYVQQLREGVPNFFATFIEVKKDREGASIDVEPDTTSGDYLHAFLLGTVAALHEMNRPSLTLSIDEVCPKSVGLLIALFERATGLYASLVNVNAYHQPGVEAGKKAATRFLGIQKTLFAHLRQHQGAFFTVRELAQALNLENEASTLHKLLEHAVLNPAKGIHKKLCKKPFDATYGCP
jgi:glucose-6-phosphate isomerase